MSRDEVGALLQFVREKGLDLELSAALTLKQAGFSIGQSVGVTDHSAERARVWRHMGAGSHESTQPEHHGREVDIVAARSVRAATIAFVVECKAFHRCQLAALEFAADDDHHQAQVVAVRGSDLGPLKNDPAPLRLQHDCRAFKLVAKPAKQDPLPKEKDHDPVWNALRQVLDCTDDAPTMPLIRQSEVSLRFPLLVVDAPLYAVRLDADGGLVARNVESALLRIAAHRSRTLREVSVVTRSGLAPFAAQAFDAAGRCAEQLADAVK